MSQWHHSKLPNATSTYEYTYKLTQIEHEYIGKDMVCRMSFVGKCLLFYFATCNQNCSINVYSTM